MVFVKVYLVNKLCQTKLQFSNFY